MRIFADFRGFWGSLGVPVWHHFPLNWHLFEGLNFDSFLARFFGTAVDRLRPRTGCLGTKHARYRFNTPARRLRLARRILAGKPDHRRASLIRTLSRKNTSASAVGSASASASAASGLQLFPP